MHPSEIITSKRQNPPQFIYDMIQVIIDQVDPEKIILFGSYVEGNQTEDSDVDLLVIMNTTLPPAERQRKISRLLYPRIAALDIIVRTPREIELAKTRVEPFIHAILEEGIVLYARS